MGQFAVPALGAWLDSSLPLTCTLDRVCTWVTSIPLGHLQFASGPRAISPAQMTDRMEVEPSLTLSNDLKRACELLERCDIIYLIIQLSYHQHTIFIQSDANVNTNTSANTNIYHSAKA